jgi:hypothetical protein
MLSAQRDSHTGQRWLFIRQKLCEAWISPSPSVRPGASDWLLWIRRGDCPSLAKCQLRLEIESRLRAWLLQRFHRRLSELSFAELWAIAQGKHPTPKRRVKSEWS